MKLPPLQTHEVYDREWVPPKNGSRFFSYDSHDTWLRDAGLGSYKLTLKSLYDVRLSDMTLCGYITIDPSKDSVRHLEIPVMMDGAVFYRPDERIRETTYRSVHIESVPFSVGHASFLCWMVHSTEDAAILLKCGGMVLGRDNLIDLQRKVMRLSCMMGDAHPALLRMNVEEINRNYLAAINRK